MNALDVSPASAPSERADLMALINASWTTQAIRAACLLRIPEALGSGPVDADGLARCLECHAPSLRRLLHALATLGLCEERDGDHYALTPVGQLLREEHPQSVRAWALLAGGRIWQRWSELDQSVRSGLSHRQRHRGRDDFDDLADSAEQAAQFHRAMTELTRPVAAAVACALEPRGARCAVDVGGGSGELMAALLAAHAGLRGVVFDLPHGLEGAAAVLASRGVAQRCSCVPGSFFDGVPAGADLYLLKSVLHNWDDERCVQILRNCRNAMAPGARVLVIERVVADQANVSAHDREVARSDLNMLVALSGRERRLSEFEALCRAAGLTLQSRAGSAGHYQVLEAVAA